MLSMTCQMNLLAQDKVSKEEDYLNKQKEHQIRPRRCYHCQPDRVLCDDHNKVSCTSRGRDENQADDHGGLPEQARLLSTTPFLPTTRIITTASTMSINTKHHHHHKQQQQQHRHQQQQKLLAATSLIMLWPMLILLTTISQLGGVESTEVECNFEKYSQGCFSQANFVCDTETNRCRCHHSTPILIDDRFCVKRSKPNESCQYHSQCDNDGGYYCLRRGQSQDTLIECQVSESLASSHVHKCKCLTENGFPASQIDLNGSSSSSSSLTSVSQIA